MSDQWDKDPNLDEHAYADAHADNPHPDADGDVTRADSGIGEADSTEGGTVDPDADADPASTIDPEAD